MMSRKAKDRGMGTRKMEDDHGRRQDQNVQNGKYKYNVRKRVQNINGRENRRTYRNTSTTTYSTTTCCVEVTWTSEIATSPNSLGQHKVKRADIGQAVES